MEKIILIGGGGHCKSCIDVIEEGNFYEISGIIDIDKKIGQNVLNYKITASDKELDKIVSSIKNFLITIGQIGTPVKRIEMFDLICKLDGRFPVIISPKAYVSKYAEIGNGTIVMHSAIINAGAVIGKNCIINTGAIIEHDAIIEDHCHISTGAIVNGGGIIKKGAFLGSSAVTKEYITIKAGSFIKANTVVKVSNE